MSLIDRKLETNFLSIKLTFRVKLMKRKTFAEKETEEKRKSAEKLPQKEENEKSEKKNRKNEKLSEIVEVRNQTSKRETRRRQTGSEEASP